MKRKLWTEFLTIDSSPAWPCPACATGTLSLVKKSLIYKETAESKRLREWSQSYSPDETRYVFTAWANCGHPSCGQDVAISGTGGEDPDVTSKGETVWTEYFVPKFCQPMPDIIEIPTKCPMKVSLELRAGFALFWSDHAAAANHVRIALERLMDHCKVKKRRKNKKGTFDILKLHQRIEEFTKAEPSIGSRLMAIKWFGNTGSHGGQVGRDELLDAFEILEHALSELVDHRTTKLDALAKKLKVQHAK